MCIVGILHAYMAYKIILNKFNQRKKIPHQHLYEIIIFLKEKIIRITLSFLFFSWQPNTIQTFKKKKNIVRWVCFSIEIAGFDFY